MGDDIGKQNNSHSQRIIAIGARLAHNLFSFFEWASGDTFIAQTNNKIWKCSAESEILFTKNVPQLKRLLSDFGIDRNLQSISKAVVAFTGY